MAAGSLSGGIPSREIGLLGLILTLSESALQVVWAQTLTILLLKLQTYSWIKSPLHFYGTSGVLPLTNLFLNHFLTPITMRFSPLETP